MSKIYLTESDIIKIVKDSTIAILNERIKSSEKEKINEGNSYKVDFKAMGPPDNPQKAGFTGPYWDNKKAKERMAAGTYGESGTFGMHGFLKDLRQLGYSNEQIQQAIQNGAIQIQRPNGTQYNRRKQNRKVGRLMTKAGGVLGTGAAKETPTSSSADDSGKHGLLKPEDMGVTPAPVTKTVYYKSDKVKQLQTLLNEKFGASLNPDGVCGPLTIDAMLNVLNNGQSNPGTQQSTEAENKPSKEDVAKVRAKEPIQKIETPKATIQTKQETMPRPQQTGGTTGYQQRMSQVYNDEKMTPDEKINAINTIVASAEKGGYKGSKELRDIANKYINGLKSK